MFKKKQRSTPLDKPPVSADAKRRTRNLRLKQRANAAMDRENTRIKAEKAEGAAARRQRAEEWVANVDLTSIRRRANRRELERKYGVSFGDGPIGFADLMAAPYTRLLQRMQKVKGTEPTE